MAADIEVPTWVKVRWLAGSPATVLVIVPVVAAPVARSARRCAGTSARRSPGPRSRW